VDKDAAHGVHALERDQDHYSAAQGKDRWGCYDQPRVNKNTDDLINQLMHRQHSKSSDADCAKFRGADVARLAHR
jgi:hypothetical protein